MKKLHIKNPKNLILAMFLVMAVLLLMGNLTLWNVKNKVADLLTTSIDKKVTISNIFYFFPNSIILKNTVVQENDLKENTVIEIPLTVLSFSIPELVQKQSLKFSKIKIQSPRVEQPRTYAYYKPYIQGLMQIAKDSPSDNLIFDWSNGRIGALESRKNGQLLESNFKVKIKKDQVYSEGNIVFVDQDQKVANENDSQDRMFQFELKGLADGDGYFINTLELTYDNFIGRFWGEVNGENLHLKGYSFVHRIKPDQNDKYKIKKLKSNEKKLSRHWANNKLDKSGLVDHYILDIDTLISFSPDNLEIKRMGFTLNRAPINLKGNIHYGESLMLDCQMTAFLQNSRISVLEDFYKAKLNYFGTLKNEKIESSGDVELLLAKNKQKLGIKKIGFRFQELSTFIKNVPSVHFSLREGVLDIEKHNDHHELVLNDLTALLDMRDKLYKNIIFVSPFYDGAINGNISIDNNEHPAAINTIISLRDVKTKRLGKLWNQFASIDGRLSSQLYIHNVPDYYAYGNMQIADGQFLNFDLLNKFSGYFDMPRLQELKFKKISTQFDLFPKVAKIYKIKVESHDLNMLGSLELQDYQKLASQFSLSIANDVMQESSHFKPLLRRLKKKSNAMSFDFKLSGHLQAINFQWVETDMKETIQTKIPPFIQRRIEERIEKDVDMISTKK